MKTTKMIRKEDICRDWFFVDAKNLVLGRLATKITNILRGTNKVFYTPHLDCGDNLVVVNVDKIILTGKKWTDKIYYSHSNYPGGLKKRTANDLFKKNPALILQKAVKGMLPRNRLAGKQILRLFLYVNEKHPHEGQKPKTLNLID